MFNEEINIESSEFSEFEETTAEQTETEYFPDETKEEITEVFQIEENTEIEIYSEITSEPIITDETVETSIIETTTETTETTIDYQAEIYKNTKTSAECLAFLSGMLLIISAIIICVVIVKVLIGY